MVYEGFHKWRSPTSWMVSNGKSDLEMDDDWGYSQFRKLPFISKKGDFQLSIIMLVYQRLCPSMSLITISTIITVVALVSAASIAMIIAIVLPIVVLTMAIVVFTFTGIRNIAILTMISQYH